jgi:DNA (cytosine-5)-methyltransferase 1
MPDAGHPILSFFSGAGGLDWGFRQEHFRVILACDNFRAAVNSYNFNAKRRACRIADLATATVEDVCRMMTENAPGVLPEGIVGGPPCQGFSRGNAGSNPKDPRNRLPFKYAELLAALNKKYELKFFVFENVMGLLYARHMRRFRGIQRAFADAGFTVFQRELDAQAFGVPQLRRRLFIVGLNRRLFPDSEFTFPKGDGTRKTVRDAIAGLPRPTFFERGLTASRINYHPNHWTMQPKSAKLSTEVPTDGRSFRRIAWDDVSPTVAYGNREIHVHPDGGRRLSVHEAMLLQGFPSGYRLAGNFSEQVTQVSNAVPPPVARALARSIRALLVARAKE